MEVELVIFLRKLFAQVQSQLTGMTTSQRLVFGLLAVLMVVAMVWLVQWTGRNEYVPLLDQAFTPEQREAVRSKLDQWGIRYTEQDERILVSATQQRSILARLSEARALPDEAWIGFKNLMEQNSPFVTNDENERRWTVALSSEISRLLTDFAKIKHAKVIVVPAGRHTFGGKEHAASATVSVEFVSGFKPDSGYVEGIAAAVARAVRGLDPKNVSIVDTGSGRHLRVPDQDDLLAQGIFAKRTEQEKMVVEKIRKVLQIPGLLVEATVDLMTEEKRQEDLVYGPDLLASSENKVKQSQRSGPGWRPGVESNTGEQVKGAGGATDKTLEKIRSETYSRQRNTTFTETKHRPGTKINRIAATLSVPRSYFVKIFQAKANDQEKVPSDEQLQPIIDEELESIKKRVVPLVAAEKPGLVEVSSYWDDIVLATTQSQPSQADEAVSGALKRMVTGNVKQLALGSLAAVSLLMMLMLARKSGVAVPGASGGGGEREAAERIARHERLANEIPVVHAEDSESALTGIEVNPEMLRTRKILEQVEEMVKSEPEMAAGLVKRWLAEDS